MSTSCSDIVTRAIGLSVANNGVLDPTQSADVQDALVRISQAQARAFTRFSDANKTAFLKSVVVTSTAGNGGRTVDLSVLSPRVQRIITLRLTTSQLEVALVDPNVQTSEMAPRYITEGETLVEVSNEWDTATANAVSLTLLHTTRPPDLDTSTNGLLSQAVSIPDRYTDILVYDLGAYLAQKDVGREDAEVTMLEAKRDEALAAWITSATQFGGVAVYAFEIPQPTVSNKN